LVDAGNYFGRRTPQKERTYSKVIIDYMRKTGYDAVGIGEREMNYGMAFLEEELKQGHLDAVCANLYSGEDSSLIFQPYVIKDVGGIKVGLMGLLNDDPRRVGVFEQLEGVYVGNYYEAAYQYLPELEAKADIVVALAAIGLGNAKQMVKDIPGFDVVLVAHGADRTPMAEKVNETIVMKAGTKSSSVGTLLLVFDNNKNIIGYDGYTHMLTKKGRVNPDVERVVKACEEGEQQRERLLARRKFKLPNIPRRPDVLAAEGYLGWDTCRICHSEIYERWSKGPHAHAFETLAADDKWNDPACLPCHVTGYEVAARRDSSDVKPELWNVQCEACHGPGTKHRRDGTMAPVGEDVCLKCHTPEWSPDWNYKEALKRSSHGTE
jgi:hypothetical protein